MSRLETVQNKYPQINWESFKLFDPSKNGKYLDWLGSNAGSATSDDGNRLKNLIEEFERRKDSLKEKDIYKYSAETLQTEIQSLKPSIKEAKEAGIVDFGEFEGTRIVLLNTHAAAKKYCAETQWCISNPNTFYKYCKHSNIFVAIRNKSKIAIQVSIRGKSWTAFDTNDVRFEKSNKKSSFNKFRGMENDPVIAVAEHCCELSKTNINLFKTQPLREINKESLISLFEKLGGSSYCKITENVLQENVFTTGTKILKTFQFLSKTLNDKELDGIRVFFAQCKDLTVYAYKNRKTKVWQLNRPKNYINFGPNRIYISRYLNYTQFIEAFGTPKQKAVKPVSIYTKIKQAGGLRKALDDSNLRKEIITEINLKESSSK